MEVIESILAVDWVKYALAAQTLLIALVTAVDAFVIATPTKWDNENVGPFITGAKAFLARFSLFRGKR